MDKSKLRKLLVGEFTIMRLVGSLVFIYVTVLLFAYFFADRFVFLRKKSSYIDNPEIIKIEVGDGVNLSALYLKATRSEFTILYSHGNGEDIGDLREIFENFQSAGYSVFAYDYRGYGTSDGRASEKNFYADAGVVYSYLVNELKNPPEKIIVLGRSIGGAAAIDIASKEIVAGLILEGAFTSAFRVAMPIVPFPFDKFNNIDKIDKVRCPVLFIHGRDDTIVPFSHGLSLFEKANEPKRSFWVEDAGHNDLYSVADVKYWENLKKFEKMISNNGEAAMDGDGKDN
ncbi:MAG: alpha/beta hydrolase [Planctomycetota bacterium]|jgi:fermentation-respiration switch protein FrsA (DUF1100 family)